MEEKIRYKNVKTIEVKGQKYRMYKGRFLPPEDISDPKIRGGRIKEILKHGSPNMLSPGDFYFAWKWGLLRKEGYQSSLVNESEIESCRGLSSKEKVARIKEEDAPVAFLARKYGFSDAYVRKIKAGKAGKTV